MSENNSNGVIREEYLRAVAKVSELRLTAKQRGVELDQDGDTGLKLQHFTGLQFIDAYPELRPYLIDGLLRTGEVANVIGSTKQGKSWFILGCALSVAQGVDWLGRSVQQGKVLLIDNELQRETLAYRLRRVARAMKVPEDVGENEIIVLPLRGRLMNINELWAEIAGYTDVSLICLDAFYRCIPKGVSENDNAQMTGIYNTVSHYAETLDCAFLMNHHSSKGEQGGKSISDVGSGAGAISRTVDTHITFRPHQKPGLSVLEAVCRSSAPPEAMSISFDWPIWSISDDEPELKQRATPGASNQAAKDKEADEAVRTVLIEVGEAISRNRIMDKTGIGPSRVSRSLFRQRDQIEESQQPNPKNRKATIDCFRWIGP